MNHNVSPDLVKFVSIAQNGRSTACQPTIRESPNDLVGENTGKRKGSMPNVSFFQRNTRNNRKIPGENFTTRHYSTERGHIMHNKEYTGRNDNNNS
jgi:hypothetical protein